MHKDLFAQVMQRIASAYHEAPERDSRAARPYFALAAAVEDQFNAMSRTIAVEFVQDDPYQTAAQLCAEIDTGRMRVYDSRRPEFSHPFLTAEMYNRLRAVHDYRGHYLGRTGQRSCHAFAALGEANAFAAHLREFPPIAAPALVSEVVAPNAWYAHGPFSHLPQPERPYAPRKACYLAPDLWLGLIEDTDDRRTLEDVLGGYQ